MSNSMIMRRRGLGRREMVTIMVRRFKCNQSRKFGALKFKISVQPPLELNKIQSNNTVHVRGK